MKQTQTQTVNGRPLLQPKINQPFPAGISKRRYVAEVLETEISDGIWPLRSVLPSEMQLVMRFEVSRQTIRSAMTSLQAKGLIATRQGLGSIVLRQFSSPEYSQSLESINALAYFARHTVVSVVSVEDVVLTQDLAVKVGGKIGTTWSKATTLRAASQDMPPMGVSSVWVPVANRQAIQVSRKSGMPVFLEIQKANKQMVSEVKQVLGASMPDKLQARLLQCEPREPMLRIQRWYYAADATLLEMSETLHPPSRFQYLMTLRHVARSAS
jgi:GntR family transcriptional regulator